MTHSLALLDRFFLFDIWVAKKGSGERPISFLFTITTFGDC